MTQIGKLLAIFELILGVGIAVLSTAQYTNRPGWFDKASDTGTDKGNRPMPFEALAAEIDVLGKQATLASKGWGDELKDLEARESLRKGRNDKMFGKAGLLEKGRTAVGGDSDPAFRELKEDEATRLIDLATFGPPVTVLGPGDKPVPVGGAENLLGQFEKDAKLAEGLVVDIAKLRVEQKALGAQVVVMEQRLLKQNVIRENLYNEATHLAAFEVNAGEQRDTVTRRRQQLLERLVPFRGGPMGSGN